MRVLFWGTPDFAVPSLEALLGEGFEVCGVVTQPDRPVGRSRSQLATPPVKKVAERESIPVFQPETTKDAAFRSALAALAPDISVVVAYGRLLGTALLDMPRLGTINVHASLLPRLRGASPIRGAILEGHAESGVTIMRMIREMDAGPILLQLPAPIAEDETYGELSMRLSELGAAALIEALALLDRGLATETPQDESLATWAPKTDAASARIDWTAEAPIVARHIRAFDPDPGAHAVLNGRRVKLFGARQAAADGGEPGAVLEIDAAGALIACGRGAIRVQQVLPEGGKRMDAAAWQRGRGIAAGDRFDVPAPAPDAR